MKAMMNTLSNRIGGGYALMILLLALTVTATMRQVEQVRQANHQLDAVRMPVLHASVRLLNGVNQSSAALRGWVILRDSSFITERHVAWATGIDSALTELQITLPRSSDATARQHLQQVIGVLDAMRVEQQAAEDAPTAREAAMIVTQRSAPAARTAAIVISELVDKQRELVRADLDQIDEQVEFLNSLQWIILFLSLAIGMIMAIVVTRSIVRPVTRAVAIADNIASGDLDTEIQVSGSNELEVLGTALTTMRNALKIRVVENERQNWLGNGQRQLDEVLRGEKRLGILAGELLATIAGHAGAETGSIFMMDPSGRRLRLMGGYAPGENIPEYFETGQGLPGQVAADGNERLLTVQDQTHLRINSSLISAGPTQILVIPFKFEEAVLGVIELGKLQPFNATELEFIRGAMRSIGIAVNASLNQEKINDLLEETQRQSEELQVQQEELQQTNEELEEQASRLKIQQEELQVTNEELEEQTQTVAQRNSALEAARQEVERKARQLELTSKYKSEFLANMSHELRTPLNSLLILSDHLARNKHGNLRDEQVESARVIAKSGHDLLALINDILDLSKVEAGKLDLNYTNVQGVVLADDIRTSFGHVAQEKGLALEVEVDPAAPRSIWSDHQRLGQIIKNLISNAIKFTEKGKVRVVIGPHPGQGWAISVEDTGIGIPQEKLQLIFEAFQQVDGSTSRKFGGTGLGLSIARELATLLGGSISVKSEMKHGSFFSLVLPPTAPEVVFQEDDRDHVLPPPQNIRSLRRGHSQPQHTADKEEQRILIIEDDEPFAMVLAEQATNRGFQVLTATSGEQGLELVAKNRVHAIMLDLDLPGMDGRAVLEHLKNDPHLRHIPVHILSVRERTMEPIRAGAVEYLEKPVSQKQLDEAFTRIQDLLQRKMKNLLIVEDNAEQRMAIKELLGNGDVHYLEAGSAKEGLDLLKRNPVDCIVLDIGLPDVSGFELLRLFKDNMGGALPPIIVYTGRDLSPRENDELRMYAETIIVKGIRSEERLLDETALFLHRAVKDLPRSKQEIIMDLHAPDAVFQGRKILVVDDDVRNIFALNKILAEKNLIVLRAENGAVALDILEKDPGVDMVLMDIMMPEMDGFTAMREIRKKRKWADLPVIALTAKAMKEDRGKCIEAGANDYISKPVDPSRLFSLMRIWMRKEKVA